MTPLLIAVLDRESPAQGLHQVPLPDYCQLHVLAPTADAPTSDCADGISCMPHEDDRFSAATCKQIAKHQTVHQNAASHRESEKRVKGVFCTLLTKDNGQPALSSSSARSVLLLEHSTWLHSKVYMQHCLKVV